MATFQQTEFEHQTLYHPWMRALRHFSLVWHLIQHGRFSKDILDQYGPGRSNCPCVGARSADNDVVLRVCCLLGIQFCNIKSHIVRRCMLFLETFHS